MNKEPNLLVVALGIVFLGASAAFSIVAINNNWFAQNTDSTRIEDLEANSVDDGAEVDHVENNRAQEFGLEMEFNDPVYKQFPTGEVVVSGRVINYDNAPEGKITLATEAGLFTGLINQDGNWSVSISPENLNPDWWSMTARYRGNDFSIEKNIRLDNAFKDLNFDFPTTELSVSWHRGGPFRLDDGAWGGETTFAVLMKTVKPWSLGTIIGGEFDGYELLAKYWVIDGPFYGPTPLHYFLINRDEESLVAMPRHGTSARAFEMYNYYNDFLKEVSFDGQYEFITSRYDLLIPSIEPEQTHTIANNYVIEKSGDPIGFTTQAIEEWDSEKNKYTEQGLRVPVGQTVDGKRVYQKAGQNPLLVEAESGVLYEYQYRVPFMGEYGRIPSIIWNNGLENENEYTLYRSAGCGGSTFAYRKDLDLDSEDFIVAGVTTKGESIYAHADNNDSDLLELYDRYGYTGYGSDRRKLSYDEFIALRPVLFWKEPFGTPVELRRASFQPLAECGKPVIYLYPEEEQEVDVFVNLKGPMTVSIPEHGEDGWSVLAHIDGYVTNLADNLRYPNLFWEGYGVVYETSEKGFVVAQEDLPSWLDKTLIEIGFTHREKNEFLEFWLPNLPKSPYVFITFIDQYYFDRDAALRISPKPDTINRIFMEYAPLSRLKQVEPQVLPKIKREGFTVVEWGGALYK